MHSNSRIFACGAFSINIAPTDFCMLITTTCIFVTPLLARSFIFYILRRHFMSVCSKQNVRVVALIYSKDIMQALIFCTCHPQMRQAAAKNVNAVQGRLKWPFISHFPALYLRMRVCVCIWAILIPGSSHSPATRLRVLCDFYCFLLFISHWRDKIIRRFFCFLL